MSDICPKCGATKGLPHKPDCKFGTLEILKEVVDSCQICGAKRGEPHKGDCTFMGGMRTLDDLLEDMKKHPLSGEFKSEPFYERYPCKKGPDLDLLTWHLTGEAEYAEWVNHYLTVFKSRKDDNITGFQLTDISLLLKKVGFKLVKIDEEDSSQKSQK